MKYLIADFIELNMDALEVVDVQNNSFKML